MKFIEFKNYLTNNKILLFDYDYRTCYKNMFKLNDDIYSNQIGGASNGIYISPFIIIKKINTEKSDQKRLELLIKKLNDNNLVGAKYLCQNSISVNL